MKNRSKDSRDNKVSKDEKSRMSLLSLEPLLSFSWAGVWG